MNEMVMSNTYADLPNERVSGANGVDYAYRDTGGEKAPLVLLQHFRGNLDSWDPALIDALAAGRRVITFDNAGVGGSSGTTPDTNGQMARDAIAFLAAMGLSPVDLLGFSIGSFVAQEIALIRPAVVRRVVLASSAPQGAAGCTAGPRTSSERSGSRRPAPMSTLMCRRPSGGALRSRRSACRVYWHVMNGCRVKWRLDNRTVHGGQTGR
jgi:pimeloyl-ACP methyl ester carboxylesterase